MNKQNRPFLFIKEIILHSLGYVAAVILLISLPIIYFFSPLLFPTEPQQPSHSITVRPLNKSNDSENSNNSNNSKGSARNSADEARHATNHEADYEVDREAKSAHIESISNLLAGHEHSLSITSAGSLWAWGGIRRVSSETIL